MSEESPRLWLWSTAELERLAAEVAAELERRTVRWPLLTPDEVNPHAAAADAPEKPSSHDEG